MIHMILIVVGVAFGVESAVWIPYLIGLHIFYAIRTRRLWELEMARQEAFLKMR